MHAKKSAVLALVASTFLLSTMLVPSTFARTIDVMYNVNGTYDLAPDQMRVVDEMMSVTYNDDVVTINYYMTTLPYGIDAQLLYLSNHSRETMQHEDEGYELWEETSMNPFQTIFGCPSIVMIKTTDEYKLTIKWHKYYGFMLYMEIEKLHEMQKVIRFSYQSSSVNLYDGLSKEVQDKINLVKFLFSPAGIAVMAVPFFTILIIACYISGTKKKINSFRGGRTLTR